MINKNNRFCWSFIVGIPTLIFLILTFGFVFKLITNDSQYTKSNTIFFIIFTILFLICLGFFIWISKWYKCCYKKDEIQEK